MKKLSLVLSLLFFCWLLPLQAEDAKYDPLKVDPDQEVETTNLVVKDTKRKREIPLKVYFPETNEPAPVVLFSHGLGGSKENNSYLGNHWAKRGYVAVFMQHAGSDEAVWKDGNLRERMNAMKKAASAKNAKLRYEDVHAVIDALETWNAAKDHKLFDKLDLDHIGMSGHSFGAVTTQGVSGQQALMGMIDFTDDRIDAALAFSPSSPRGGRPQRAFGKVKIPWMLMTGTEDISAIGNTDLESRLAVFPALPERDKYELVLHEAEHSAFSERALPGDRVKRNPNHHRAILALGTAFWDAYLKNDQAAKDWLKSDAVKKDILEPKDRWQLK